MPIGRVLAAHFEGICGLDPLNVDDTPCVESAPIWHPNTQHLTQSNMAELMRRLGVPGFEALCELAKTDPERYWSVSIAHLGLTFDAPPTQFVDMSRGKPWARFFPGGRFNFARACLKPPSVEGAGAPALIFESESREQVQLSYAELAERTVHFAAGLSKLGIKAGDRVALQLPNVPEAVIAFLAIAYIGAIAVPLYSGFGSEAVATRLADAEACCLITAGGFIRRNKFVPLGEVALRGAEQVGSIRHIIWLGSEIWTPNEKCIAWSDVEGDETIEAEATATTDPFMVIYTSGTTGRPKGAIHVHAGFPLRVAHDAAYLFDFRTEDRLFWRSDMGWMVGPFSIIASLLLKGTLVLYDGAPDQPDYGRLRSIAGQHGVTHFGLAPTAIRALAAAEAEALSPSASSLRVLVTAGEVIEADTFKWYQDKFGRGLPIINYTGGTEVSGAILSNVILRPIKPSRFNCVPPAMSAGVVDESGLRTRDVVGELAIFEPFVGMTAGFWRDADRYLASYWSQIPGIWVHGDLAIEDGDGQFRLIGRSDDVMKIAGRRVGPTEIEAAAIEGAPVTDALACGVPDPRSGEAIILFVVPSGPTGPSFSDKVSAAIAKRLGAPFRPHAVVEVTRLPKTRNGKVVRRIARAAWLETHPGDLSALENAAIYDELLGGASSYRAKAAGQTRS